MVAELEEVLKRRGDHVENLDPKRWIEHCHQRNLFGICISGGGIRSATFALGVLQGLVEKTLLSRADYISTVSGGGYIGAWLQGLAAREPNYERVLNPERPPDVAAKDPISFLRKYSNYLAPRNGLSLDALVIPLIWFRNMILNQAIIVSAFVAIFIILLMPGALLRYIAASGSQTCANLALAGSIILALVAVYNIGSNLRRIVKREFGSVHTSVRGKISGNQHIGLWIAWPLFIAVLLLIVQSAVDHNAGAIFGFVVLFALIALLQVGGGFPSCYIEQKQAVGKAVGSWVPYVHVFWMSSITASFLLVVVAVIRSVSSRWDPSTASGSQFVIAWAPPLYVLALIAGVGLHIGLMGRDFPDASREWLVRVGALILTIIGVWTTFFALGEFAPLGIVKLWLAKRHWLVASGAGGWILSTIMSVLAGKSPKTGGLDRLQTKQSSAIDLVARYGPFIAIPGFLAVVAFGTQLLLHIFSRGVGGAFFQDFDAYHWDALPYSWLSWVLPLLLLGFTVFIFVVLSLRVNINEFSMHHFYKNRLVRCYLGASATKHRQADPFTGFDPKDDIKLSELRFKDSDVSRPRVPYPLVNAAMTITAGVELATQERKALPWIFSPLYSGFFPARSDKDRVERDPHAKPPYADSSILGTGLALGTATGISGAAVNPNMGFHSSPQTAFLLTLFNVRLGWWLGNPTKSAFRKAGPTFALWWLARELFGFVDEGSQFANLSDGGHFENLGLYELVRRRCRYIIAVDGEQDTDYRFESLGGAIRKCRADFGIEIEIDPKPITPQSTFSRTHCVVGRIRYEQGQMGRLLYLKASITGDEPADVEQYRRENPGFPQQSTLDQFFSESQFESYRRLGLHVARTALDHIGAGATDDLEHIFKRLESQWLLPPLAPEGTFARHGETYAKLLAELARSRDLDSIVMQNILLPADGSDEQRRKFFFHLQLLQLIEEVFVDLDFASAQKWNHPATEGWRSLITYWAGQSGMREVWESQKEGYGQPFRNCFDDLVHSRQGVPFDQQK
ncbi:MAG: patatin-like phospholipase family protein [Silvibacterium sp.]|nr:patatin-like phospholipase family protein [Silvibacterium sp.]